MEHEDRAAIERLMWKRSGPDVVAGPTISREEEIEDARRGLSGTLPLLIDRERARRDRDLLDAAEVVAKEMAAGRDLDDDVNGDANRRFKAAMTRAKAHQDRIEQLEAIAEEKRAILRVGVLREPRVYGPGSEHRYYRDLALAAVPGHPEHRDALDRLHRYSRELALEVAGGSAEGRRALEVATTRGRERGDVHGERRAMTSSSASGGAFVTPQYLVEDVALFRTFSPSFTMQATQVTDPGHGLQINVPAFTSPASAAVQAGENQGIDNVTPSGAYLTAPMVTVAGEVDISQQLLDRAGPILADEIVHRQLMTQVWTAVDAYVLGQALAGAGTVTDTHTTATPAAVVQDLYSDLGTARAQMQTAAGTVLAPTHLFMTPTFYDWACALVDGSGRPLMTPVPAAAAMPVQPGRDGGSPVGYTGERILSTAVFTDGNIPTTNAGADTQLVMAHMPEVFVEVTEPALRTIPETLANTLSVVVQAYVLVGVIVRHAAAVQSITGARYPASPTYTFS